MKDLVVFQLIKIKSSTQKYLFLHVSSLHRLHDHTYKTSREQLHAYVSSMKG